jgi:hypothetical protein
LTASEQHFAAPKRLRNLPETIAESAGIKQRAGKIRAPTNEIADVAAGFPQVVI